MDNNHQTHPPHNGPNKQLESPPRPLMVRLNPPLRLHTPKVGRRRRPLHRSRNNLPDQRRRLQQSPQSRSLHPQPRRPTCRVASCSDNGAMWFYNAFGYQVWLQSMRTLASAVRIVLDRLGYDNFMESGTTKMEKRVRRARGQFGEGGLRGRLVLGCIEIRGAIGIVRGSVRWASR